MRATVSPAFPAVNGLITLIGLAGHVSALAATVTIERATAAKHADNVRIDIMFCTRKPVTPRSRGVAALARRAKELYFHGSHHRAVAEATTSTLRLAFVEVAGASLGQRDDVFLSRLATRRRVGRGLGLDGHNGRNRKSGRG